VIESIEPCSAIQAVRRGSREAEFEGTTRAVAGMQLTSKDSKKLLRIFECSCKEFRVVGITADVGSSRALLSDRLCHFYGSYRSVPEAFYTGISTVLSVSCFMQLQSIMYIVVVNPRYHY
jgi:hypothetical protein